MSTPPAAAPKIMVIRHAEKPTASAPAVGVTADGAEDAESLTVPGWQRSGALVGLFAPVVKPGLAVPEFLYATGVGPHSKSQRPQQTLTAVAAKLGLGIDTRFLKGGGRREWGLPRCPVRGRCSSVGSTKRSP